MTDTTTTHRYRVVGCYDTPDDNPPQYEWVRFVDSEDQAMRIAAEIIGTSVRVGDYLERTRRIGWSVAQRMTDGEWINV